MPAQSPETVTAALQTYFRPNHAAAYLDIGRSTLYRLMSTDPAFPRPIKLGRSTLLRREELDAYVLRMRREG
ncbi:helix-turn-helix domain-containing protein [Jeongeupia wiesaeckerbachi]|uniref:helix-turn-helix transcriptional regulator n=1 Tax=Jeongeupia wiesaeckerbachi TaxID=3051218 RepID=UPI003D806888